MASLTAASLRPTERRALERLVELLEDELGGAGLETIWLYGSRARGEPDHEDSDVDVAARAMLSEEDLFARTHDGTWQLVRETFALTGRFPIALVQAAQAAQALRVATDYEDAWPSLDQATEALAVAERFVDEAAALIGRPRG